MIMQTKTTIATITMISVLMVLLAGCESQNTYSKLREKEKKVISDYIEREGLSIVNELPTTWGEKVYYQVPDYDDFYIHIISQDPSARKAEAGNIMLTRYKKYGLDAYSDTTRYWTTDDGGEPVHFQLGNSSDEYYCAGWTVAVSFAKYSGSICRIICPSKMGFSSDNSSVTPYGYELKFTIKP